MAGKSNDELQREILEAQLETSKITLEQSKESSAAYRQKREAAAKGNAQRQEQFTATHNSLRRLQRKVCQHLSGGDAGSPPTEGGGKFAFSAITCTLAPDGVTKWLQCSRCRLFMKWRERTAAEEAKLQTAAAKAPVNSKDWLAWDDYIWGRELYAAWRKDGIGKQSLMRGPTFNFEKDGVPFVPDTTGYATSGAGGR